MKSEPQQDLLDLFDGSFRRGDGCLAWLNGAPPLQHGLHEIRHDTSKSQGK